MVLGFELPKSDWRPPARIPDLSNEKIIAIDTEVKDPLLTSKGPGWNRGDGYVCGVSVAHSGGCAYFPLAHFGDTRDGSYDRTGLDLDLLRDLLFGRIASDAELVFANAQYDLGWLRYHGIDLTHFKIRDIQIAECLLDEEPEYGYGLDALAEHYLGESKEEGMLQAAARAYQVHPKKEMWKLPARYVGPYGEADARQTREIYLKQKPLLEAEGLWDLFELESAITPIFSKMNERGIAVDLEKAQRLNDGLLRTEKSIKADLARRGIGNPNAPHEIARYCDRNAIAYPRTMPTSGFPDGQPSFTKEFLSNSAIDVFKLVARAREIAKIRSEYVERDLLLDSVGGRVHPNFVQMASDEGGTRSGRIACKKPNVQQIPKRSSFGVDPETFVQSSDKRSIKLGAVVRSLYVPEPGQCWCKLDYSSQEPRILVHYSLGLGLPGAERAAEFFANGRKLYDFLQESLPSVEYSTIKNLYLGRCYGMGVGKMAHTIGTDPEECRRILRELDEKAPFIGLLDERVKSAVSRRGYLRTLLGRRRRFNLWECPHTGRTSRTRKAGYRRAHTHKALNALIQGSAADQAKLGILETFKAGYLPLLTLHDEGDWSVGSDREIKELQDIMENVVKLNLPTVCEPETGPHWTA